MQGMAVYLCCTCPEVAFGGCYPLSCPIKPGLSSYTAFRHCARGCSAYSDFYYTQSVPSLSSGVPPLPYSPRLYGLFAPVLRCWRANTGRGLGAVLARCHRKGWLCAAEQREERPWWLACPARERNMGAQALGPGAASPSGMIVILALCQNNTPPALQEGPGGLRREEAWGGLRRSEGSGLG